MQHHGPFGYPTPPASPSFDDIKTNFETNFEQPMFASRTMQTRCVPPAPEERLGALLEGKLQLSKILGTGAYGVVYAAVDIKTGIRYAVKCLSKFNADGTPLERRQIAYQQREIRLHYLASTHPNVVSMLKIVDEPDCIYVILEYCPEGDLFLNITELGQYVGKDAVAKKVFLQIVDAVEHCHKLGIYHRDLKPENILVTDKGETVKLADFGLATSEDRSEDYGCGSTFYMSPECLDPCTRKPYYMCAPNDVWSLGVILVNLTCGRNPWKQASFQDSTYHAYSRSRHFLKTILPLSDELNDILSRIFHPNPDHRITLPELRMRIAACTTFTLPSPASAASRAAVAPRQQPLTEYVCHEDAIVDDFDYDEPLSPASTSSDEGSLSSSASSLDDDDDAHVVQEQQSEYSPFATYDMDDRMGHAVYGAMDFLPSPPQQHYSGPVPPPAQPMHCPQPSPEACQQKPLFPLWDVVKCMQQAPIAHHAAAFHPQMHFVPTFQGCY